MQNKRFLEYNDKYTYDRIIQAKLDQGAITHRDAELLLDFIENKLHNGQIEERRAQRLSTALTQWRRFIQAPYDQMTLRDLQRGIQAMKKGDNANGEPYKVSTIRTNIKTIKTFTNYLRKKGLVSITADELDEIKAPKEVFDSIRPSDILKDTDYDKIIEHCTTIRDKAIVSVLAETGLRPIDICSLTWKDLEFNHQRVKITVKAEKTDVLVSAYVVIRKSWLVEYRNQRNGAADEDFVFVEIRGGKPMTYPGMKWMLTRAAAAAGVKLPKGAKAKLFRASMITNSIRAGYSTVSVSKMAWGSQDSRMLRHYSKLVDEDVENEVLSKTGIVDIQKPEQPHHRICNVCGDICANGAKFCPECGTPITQEAKDQVDSLDKELEADPVYQDVKRKHDAFMAELKQEIAARLKS
ncbi:tyrosine-type recombinase/integrase [Methanocella sp. MCL-LM]|uniref:tyrosine-type recombinase/integrase n=1 Tax=Methanocella sp. MCL-LM TaxID=3412035 RepID=UPI003C73E8D1